jgi:hypothetical protein
LRDRSSQRQYVRVAFSNGYQYRWPVRDDVSVADTLEEIRRAIVNSQWFVIPEAAKSYSPHAIVSVEVAMSSDDDDPPAAERLGQMVREHVIDPITETG